MERSIAVTMMKLMCENHSWSFMGIKRNDKNTAQWFVECADGTGMPVYILITKKGYFLKWIGPKNWEQIKMMPEKEEIHDK